MSRTILFLILYLFSGCSEDKVDAFINMNLYDIAQTREKMIGTWYGDMATKQNGRKKWLMTRYRDGSYAMKEHIYGVHGKISEYEEKGIWGISQPIYFSIVKKRK